MSKDIVDGIVIGGAGGAIAGITIYAVQFLHDLWKDNRDSKKIYSWLLKNARTKNNEKLPTFRSTKLIASSNNLTVDRVRYLCSHHEKIHLSTGEQDDLWSIR